MSVDGVNVSPVSLFAWVIVAAINIAEGSSSSNILGLVDMLMCVTVACCEFGFRMLNDFSKRSMGSEDEFYLQLSIWFLSSGDPLHSLLLLMLKAHTKYVFILLPLVCKCSHSFRPTQILPSSINVFGADRFKFGGEPFVERLSRLQNNRCYVIIFQTCTKNDHR